MKQPLLKRIRLRLKYTHWPSIIYPSLILIFLFSVILICVLQVVAEDRKVELSSIHALANAGCVVAIVERASSEGITVYSGDCTDGRYGSVIWSANGRKVDVVDR